MRRIRVGSALVCLVYLYGAGESVAIQAAPGPCLGANIASGDIIMKGLLFQADVGLTLDVAGETGLNWTLPYQNKHSDSWRRYRERKDAIPAACKVAAEGLCNIEMVQVYDATYDRCSLPWTFCRCGEADMSQEDTRNPFGRIGPLLMSYVRHIMAFPPPLAAWSEHQDIMFYGFSGNQTFTSNYIHQAAHALDLGLGNFSAGAQWTSAVNNDSCVVDKTASSSYSEAFAGAMVLHLYKVTREHEGLGIGFNTSCITSQLAVLKEVFPYENLFKGTCRTAIKPLSSEALPKNAALSVQPSSSSSQGSSQPLSPGVIAGIVLGVVAVMAMLSILLIQLRMRNETSKGVIEPFNSKLLIEVDPSNGDRDNNFGMVDHPRLVVTEHIEQSPMFNGPPDSPPPDSPPPDSPPPYSLLYDSQSTAFQTETTRTVEARASTVTSQMWSGPKRIM